MSEALNVTKAAFGGLREVTTAPLWQYDYGQILKITGLDLPQTFEVHFSNSRKSGETVTQIGTNGAVTIPDMYLTSGADIYCFIFLHDGLTDGETEYVIKIPVRERPEPSDIEPTPEQQDAITEAIAALNVAVTQTGEDKAATAALAEAAAASSLIATEAAQSAQGSATSASASATTASTAAATATTKASEAATSAASAASAKTAAETAETNAQAAQTAAETAAASIAPVDPTLSITGRAADAKATGDRLDSLTETVGGKQDTLTFDDAPTGGSANPVKSGGVYVAVDTKVNKPLTNPMGTNGQLLRTLGNGQTEWTDQGLPTDEQTAQAVSNWLDDHPEATTTVEDGAVTWAKLNSAVQTEIDEKAPAIFRQANGGMVTFDDGADDNAKSIICYFMFTQSGSGDPSPIDNNRPINGFDGLILYRSGEDASDYDTLPISWQAQAGTLYGGHINVVTGEIVVEWKGYDASTLKWVTTSQTAKGVFQTSVDNRDITVADNIVCNKYKTVPHNIGISSMDDYSIKGNAGNSYKKLIYIRDSRYTDLESFKQNIDAFFVVQLETPITYRIDGNAVKLLKGHNNIWSSTGGECDVTYIVDTDIYLHKRITYVTPEQYGAVGDGTTDDGAALNTAIVIGANNGKIVLCSNTYLTSIPVVIPSDANVIAEKIIYTGSDSALKVQGARSRIDVREIVSSGNGIEFVGVSATVINNVVKAGRISASKDGIVLNAVASPISCNRVEFSRISAGGINYYGIRGGTTNYYITENTFVGGTVCDAHYAMQGIGGNSRAIDFDVEGNIKGGFLNCRSLIIENDRHWECCSVSDEPYIKYTTDPAEPNAFKVGYYVKISSADVLPYNQIDLSGVHRTYNNGNNVITTSMCFGIVDCIFNPYVANHVTGSGESVMTTRAYLFADAVIFTPVKEMAIDVTEDLDLRVITPDTGILATQFIVGESDVNINLHSSYCWIGYNKIVVSQRNGYIAKVYEWWQNRCVFDGTDLGDGDYEIECYVTSRSIKADGSNMHWRYKKLFNTYTDVF